MASETMFIGPAGTRYPNEEDTTWPATENIARELDAALAHFRYVQGWANFDACEADSFGKGMRIIRELVKALRT